ncbi:penicillin-binding protein 1A [candidate division CSSED10-310 bacterium]|uniref:peptidoglycan glycosyltransferase n=1 Tax=candidate division CSSED10-310 bacterium TaxID=2855610 RepID=A0ABV6Z046_UNCC1
MHSINTRKVSPEDILRATKRKTGCRRIFLSISLLFFFLMTVMVGAALAYLFYQLPPLSQLEEKKPSIITTIYADSGEVIGEFFIERRILITESQISTYIRRAIIAIEDETFYRHWGVDFSGIFRAFVENIRARRIVQGGSTITQQLAKVLFLSPEKKLIRKIKEALLALQIEHHYTKDEILTLYLNQIYFGEGAYGIEAAALTYFNKSAHALTLAEAALLCGLPKAPTNYSPFKNPERALSRRNLVLDRMLNLEGKANTITSEQIEAAKKEPLKTVAAHHEKDVAAYFVEEIRRYLDQHYGTKVLYSEGLKVYTTLNLELQKKADAAVRKGIEDLDKRQGYRAFHTEEEQEKQFQRIRELEGESFVIQKGRVTKVAARSAVIMVDGAECALDKSDVSIIARYKPLPRIIKVGDLVLVKPAAVEDNSKSQKVTLYQEPAAEGALICLEVGTGNVKALVGGYNFNRSEFNRATQALRQVGSAFKPFVYLAAIDNGYNPVTIIMDEPVTYTDPQTHKKYSPQNHSRKFLGPITLTTALAKSINVAAVKLLDQIGIQTVIDYARKMGVTSVLNPYISLALGSSEVTLAEIANAYAIFPNGGVWKDMIMIRSITDREGRLLEQKVPRVREVVSADVAYLLNNMLEATVHRGTCWRAKHLNRAVACKTGTTDDCTDAWFVGFSPELVTGIWVGFDQKKSLGAYETGSRAAGPIWVDFMETALKPFPDSSFQIPAAVILIDIDPETGLRSTAQCPKSEVGAFIRGMEPTEYCWKH